MISNFKCRNLVLILISNCIFYLFVWIFFFSWQSEKIYIPNILCLKWDNWMRWIFITLKKKNKRLLDERYEKRMWVSAKGRKCGTIRSFSGLFECIFAVTVIKPFYRKGYKSTIFTHTHKHKHTHSKSNLLCKVNKRMKTKENFIFFSSYFLSRFPWCIESNSNFFFFCFIGKKEAFTIFISLFKQFLSICIWNKEINYNFFH